MNSEEFQQLTDECSVDDWLGEIYSLESQGIHDRAVGQIFKCVEGLCHRREFDQVDVLLARVDVGRLSTTTMLAFLSITNAYSFNLWERDPLVDRIDKRLNELVPDRADRLLEHLR